MVPYRGQCLVHRSQLQQAAGAWPDAISTIEAACDRLTDPPHPALGLAYYQAAELQRLRGAFEESETHYRQANRSGYQPLPGLALLELARGDGVAAAATIRRALAEAGSALERPALLAAAVDIFRATGDLDAAASAADELAGIAAGSTSEVLKAMADQASGTARLCAGDASVALTHLRAAGVAWHQLRMPYERARAAVLVGLACAALGDQTSAALEFDAAQDVFAALDARPDLERLAAITGAPAAHGALSGREHEVLVQIAAGRTNRDIAAELHISPNTVNRHLENIFAKLGVSSRAAATSYAYEHGLL
jgi:DNA-binding CsgD family transcriptional regulator